MICCFLFIILLCASIIAKFENMKPERRIFCLKLKERKRHENWKQFCLRQSKKGLLFPHFIQTSVCVCVCVTSKVEKQNKLRIFFDYHHMATLVCNFWFSCVLFSPFIFCWWIKKWWIKKIWLQKHSSSSSTSSSLLLDHCLWFCSHYNSLVVYCSSLRV